MLAVSGLASPALSLPSTKPAPGLAALPSDFMSALLGCSLQHILSSQQAGRAAGRHAFCLAVETDLSICRSETLATRHMVQVGGCQVQ